MESLPKTIVIKENEDVDPLMAELMRRCYDPPKFDEDVMMRFVESHPELLRDFRELNCPGSPVGKDLLLIFNNRVVNNMELCKGYRNALKRPD